ncbi:MAG: DUF4159 domain-containing protein [Acidobacteriota bacterium]|nr:MAG: DUF4159 domain-containing protein [Acidobacteriota bacterium]
MIGRSKLILISAGALVLALTGLWQVSGFDLASESKVVDVNVFNFVRIRYNGFMGSWGNRWGPPPWAHDYPRAEENFLNILSELTTVETTPDSYLILDLHDPEIMKYPVLYVSEPGYWNCTDREIENLREYLLRGGFVIFDDFRDSPGEWDNFSTCMRKAFPDRTLEELSIEHPVFHCFYDIESLEMVTPYEVPGRPTFYGMSDEEGRLQVIANFNNDIGDYWEWSDQSLVPIKLSNEAYKFGLNYVIYALTH